MGKQKRKLRPLSYAVLVKLKKLSEKCSDGGIVIASGVDHTREQYATTEAYVMRIGSKADVDGVKVGDLVDIAKYSGVDREDIEDGEIYRIINDTDLKGAYEEESVDDE